MVERVKKTLGETMELERLLTPEQGSRGVYAHPNNDNYSRERFDHPNAIGQEYGQNFYKELSGSIDTLLNNSPEITQKGFYTGIDRPRFDFRPSMPGPRETQTTLDHYGYGPRQLPDHLPMEGGCYANIGRSTRNTIAIIEPLGPITNSYLHHDRGVGRMEETIFKTKQQKIADGSFDYLMNR